MQPLESPRILWTANPIEDARNNPGARLAVPSLLVSALPPPALAAWLEGQAWAALVPLVVLADAANVDDATRYATGHERRRSGGSGRVVGVVLEGAEPMRAVVGPAHLMSGLQVLERDAASCATISPIARAVRVGERLGHACRLGAGPGERVIAWEIGADRSDGAVAVGLARALGRAVAVAGGSPGPIFVAATMRHGVSSVGQIKALEA